MRAYELAPDSEHTLSTMLFVAGWAADWEMTERAATAILHGRPDDARAIYALGRVAVARGDRERGLELYRRALAAAPGNASLLATVGDTLIDLGRYDEAIEAAKRVLAVWPDHTLAWCGVAQGACSAGRFEEGLRAADRAVELDPDNDFALRLRAAALWALGRDGEALASARRAARDIRAASMPARPWVDLALKLLAAGELDEAEEALEHAVQLGPHLVIVHAAVARLALARRQPGRAAEGAAAALTRDAHDARAHCAAGYAGAAREDWRFARAAFTRAHEIDGRSCCARAGLLLSRIELGEPGVDVEAGLRDVDETSAGCRCELLGRISAHL
jgi:tetratricopeptide (TPR) repeat protein